MRPRCISTLRQNQTIRAILGSFLLLVFLVSITPKRYWHDALAHHTDNFSLNKDHGTTQVNKGGFNCDWNMQVATSPFTELDEVRPTTPLLIHERHYGFSNISFYSFTLLHRALRGPPAIA